MNIKTVATVDGVNAVDFGAAASRFYWFKNIGTSTVYVSGDPDITADGDGVAELPAGGSVCIETLGGKVYVLGAGKIQIHNSGDKFCPFKIAPVATGGGGLMLMKWDLYHNPDPYNFKSNTKNQTNYNNSGYNFASSIPNVFGMYQSYSSYNMTHSYAVDFTDVKKIKIHTATKSNTPNLTATAYCQISAETLTEMNDSWTVINQSVGEEVSEKTFEIDCSSITGENYIYFAILHGTENTGMTSYLFIYDIEFIYG